MAFPENYVPAQGLYSQAERDARFDLVSPGSSAGYGKYTILQNNGRGEEYNNVLRRVAGNALAIGIGLEVSGLELAFGAFNKHYAPSGGHIPPFDPGPYIEEVGNGSDADHRSNARSLDWAGNETLGGKLTLGAAPTEDMDAATKKYVDDAVSGGGSYIPATEKGAANGVATLDGTGKVPAGQLPTIPSTASDVNAVSTEANQGLTSIQQSNARANIGAGTSSFSGSYNDLTNKPTIPAAQVNSDWNASSGVAQILNKPTLGTAAAKDVPSAGVNASTTQIVMGDDSRLINARTPTSHLSAIGVYGIADDELYGHLKLSASTSSTSGTSDGFAATPSAVKAAYDAATKYGGKIIHTKEVTVNIPANASSSPSYTLFENTSQVEQILSCVLIVTAGSNTDAIQGYGEITGSGATVLAQAFIQYGNGYGYVKTLGGATSAATGTLVVRYTLTSGN